LADVRILAEKLQAFGQWLTLSGGPSQRIEAAGDEAVTEPMVAAHFNPRDVPFDNAHGHDAVGGGLVGQYRAGTNVAVVDVMKRDGTTRFFQFAAGDSRLDIVAVTFANSSMRMRCCLPNRKLADNKSRGGIEPVGLHLPGRRRRQDLSAKCEKRTDS